ADRDLPDLCPATHDDDPLAVDGLQRIDYLDPAHHRQLLERRDEQVDAPGEVDLEVHEILRRPLARDLDRRDVAAELGDRAGELMQNPGSTRGSHLYSDSVVHHDALSSGIVPRSLDVPRHDAEAGPESVASICDAPAMI